MSGQPGVVTAVVATDPDSQGRLGLRYPWLPQGDTLEPVYAPVAAALAGPSRGAWFMPEEGDEVLVAFDRGDWNCPFVVGFLWNGQDEPPETDRQNRVILTPGGHTLRFEDGDAKRVILRTDGGHEIKLDDDGSKVTVTSSNGHEIALDDGGSKLTVTSSGGHVMTLDDNAGSAKLSISGDSASVTLDSTGATVVGGGHSVALTSSGVAIA